MDAEKILEAAYGKGAIARGYKAKGVVIHNDAGSQGATAVFYKKWLNGKNAKELEAGFAHYYVSSDGTYQFASEDSIAWHTANPVGNQNFIGIEADQSMGDLAQFKKNEANALKLAAQVLKRLGLKPNRDTVKLHKQFVSTSCPHRSVDIHGDGTKVQDYFIAEIAKYMGQKVSTPAKANATVKKSAIQQFKNAGNAFTATGQIKVDAIKQVNGIWQFVNFSLAGAKSIKDINWTNNGIPLAIVDNVTRGNQAATKVGNKVKFMPAYNHGKIDHYDNASNGIGIIFAKFGEVWFNATAFLKL